MTSMSAICIDELVAVPDAGGVPAVQPECGSTRAAIPGYLDRRLDARRKRRFEAHIDRCAGCIRAFIDVRQVGWAQRGASRPQRGVRRWP
ncbi:hypothetical protein GCM10010413_22730 [Promicromonospora sukumoe]